MKVNFLDVVIKIKNGRLSTDFYSKPVDCHKYFHYNSCHTEHVKKFIIYSQALRLRRICSEIKNLKSHVKDLKGWFLRRDILNEQSKSKWIRRLDFLENMIPSKTKLKVVFHELLLIIPHLGIYLRHWKNFNILYSGAEVSTVFTPNPFVAYRST